MELLLSGRDAGTAYFASHLAIDALGTDAFPAVMVSALHEMAGVEHYSAYAIDPAEVKLVAAGSIGGRGEAQEMGSLYATGNYWQSDPTIPVAKNAYRDVASALRLSPQELPARVGQAIFLARQVCDRVFLCAQRESRWYGLSIVRTNALGLFEPDAVRRLGAVADALISLVAQHDRMRCGQLVQNAADLLSSVPVIERRLKQVLPALSPREVQVCARLLRGISTPGIAIDLGLAEHSVATYRKRAYRRLDIGTRFELQQMYLQPDTG